MRRLRYLVVVVALGLSLGLVAAHVEHQRHAGGLWRDEVNSVNLAQLPSFAEAVANHHLDSFPVVWVTVAYAWRSAVGGSDAACRALGLIVGLATIAAMWWAGRQLGLAAPIVTLLLFGMSPSVIVYGDSFRGYGLGALAVFVCMGALWRFIRAPAARTFLVAQLATLFAVQAYFPNAILLAAMCAGAAVVAWRRGEMRTIAAVVALGAVAALSLLSAVPYIRYAYTVAPLEQASWSLGVLLNMFSQTLAPGVALLTWGWMGAALLALIGCGLALRRPASEERPADAERAAFVLVSACTGFVLYFAYLRVVARLHSEYWHYLSLMALVALVCDTGTQLLARRFRFGEAWQAAAVAVVALLVARDVAAAVRVRMTDVDLITTTLEREARPDDLVVVLPWYCGITFQRYYRGAAPWITLPDIADHSFHRHHMVAEKMRLGDAGIRPELDHIERTLRAGGRVWVAGMPLFPAEASAAPVLPPAPEGPEGWRIGPYLEGWRLQLGATLRAHARNGTRIALPAVGLVNAQENLPLLVFDDHQ